MLEWCLLCVLSILFTELCASSTPNLVFQQACDAGNFRYIWNTPRKMEMGERGGKTDNN